MASDTRIVYTFVASGQQTVAAAFQSIEQAARKSGKAVEQSTRDGEKAQRAAGARARSEASQTASEQVRASAKSAETQIAHANKVADSRIRAAERAADGQIRADRRSSTERVRTEDRAAQRIADAHRKKLLGLGRDIAFSTAAAGVGALTAISGAVAREAMKLDDATTRLSISSRGAGQTFADPKKLQEEFRAVAVKTGVSSADIASGMSSFVSKTGRLDLGRNFAETIGFTASATGASVEDVSATAADLVTKFQIESVEDLQAAMSGLAYQGKLGAFELKDAAAQFARMGAAASSFGIGTGPQAVRVLGGLAQIARDATGSPEQAATSVERVLSAFISKGDAIKRQGVDVFRNNKARDPRDILVELISKAGGNNKARKLDKLNEIFGEMGIRAVNPLVSAYGNAYDAAQGTDKQRAEAATTALRQRIDDAVNAAGDWSEIVKDANKSQTTLSAQLSSTWEQMMTELAPIALEAMPLAADAMKRGAAALVDLAKMLGYKPTESTHQQKAEELKVKAADAGARLEKAKKSGASPAQIAALESEVGMYQSSAAAESAQIMAPAAAVFGGDMTEEQFKQQLDELGKKSGKSWIERTRLSGAATNQAAGTASAVGWAKELALARTLPGWIGQIATGRYAGLGEVAKGADASAIESASPEERALIERYTSQVRQGLGAPRDPNTRAFGDGFVEMDGRFAPVAGATPVTVDALRGNGPRADQGAADAYQKKIQEMTEAAEKQRKAYEDAAAAAKKAADAMREVKSPSATSAGGSVVVGG